MIVNEKKVNNNVFCRYGVEEFAKNNKQKLADNLFHDERSDEEVILTCGKGIDDIISEMYMFHDKVAEIIYKNNISLKNNICFLYSLFQVYKLNMKKKLNYEKSNNSLDCIYDFVTQDIVQNDNLQDLRNLVACYLSDSQYILNFKRIVRRKLGKISMARYLRLQKNSLEFLNKVEFIRKMNLEKEDFFCKVLSETRTVNKSDMDTVYISRLKWLFKTYVLKNDDSEYLIENLEYIHKFCIENKERKMIYPVLMFRILTKFKSKIYTKNIIITTKNLLNYKEYIIDKNNGKNYNTNESYLNLFFELCNDKKDKIDLNLNLYMFQKICNLGEWYFQQYPANNDFWYTYEMLLHSACEEFVPINNNNSVYFDQCFSYRKLRITQNNHGHKRKNILEDKYINDIINKHIDNLEEKGKEYLKNYVKGKRYANVFVESIKDNLIKYAETYFQSDFYFIRHMDFNIEYTLKAKARDYLESEMSEFLDFK